MGALVASASRWPVGHQPWWLSRCRRRGTQPLTPAPAGPRPGAGASPLADAESSRWLIGGLSARLRPYGSQPAHGSSCPTGSRRYGPAILLHSLSAACLSEAMGIFAAAVRHVCLALLSAALTFALLVVI